MAKEAGICEAAYDQISNNADDETFDKVHVGGVLFQPTVVTVRLILWVMCVCVSVCVALVYCVSY